MNRGTEKMANFGQTGALLQSLFRPAAGQQYEGSEEQPATRSRRVGGYRHQEMQPRGPRKSSLRPSICPPVTW